MKNLITAFFAFALVTSCTTQNTNNNAQTLNLELSGTYTLEFIDGTNIDEGFPNKKPTLTLESISKKLTGNTGCNTMFGSFTTEQNKVTFSGLGMTKMFCEGVKESEYTTSLEKVATYRIDEHKLRFFDANGKELLRFTRGDF